MSYDVVPTDMENAAADNATLFYKIILVYPPYNVS